MVLTDALRMRPGIRIFLAVIAVIVLSRGGAVAQGGPLPAHRTLDPAGHLAPGKKDRCPVCAMYPARRPDSAAALTLASGETFYFCSNGCLLRTWLRPMVYLGRPRDRIDRIVVQDYFTGAPVDGRKATWIAGSDVVGPMGPAIIALGDAGALEAFKKRHGGTAVFSFDDLNDTLWKRIGRHDLPPAQAE